MSIKEILGIPCIGDFCVRRPEKEWEKALNAKQKPLLLPVWDTLLQAFITQHDARNKGFKVHMVRPQLLGRINKKRLYEIALIVADSHGRVVILSAFVPDELVYSPVAIAAECFPPLEGYFKTGGPFFKEESDYLCNLFNDRFS